MASAKVTDTKPNVGRPSREHHTIGGSRRRQSVIALNGVGWSWRYGRPMTTRSAARRGLVVLALLGGVVSMHALSVAHIAPSAPSELRQLAVVPHASHDSGRMSGAESPDCHDTCPLHAPLNGAPHPATSMCLAVLSLSVVVLLLMSMPRGRRPSPKQEWAFALRPVNGFLPSPPSLNRLCVLRI